MKPCLKNNHYVMLFLYCKWKVSVIHVLFQYRVHISCLNACILLGCIFSYIQFIMTLYMKDTCIKVITFSSPLLQNTLYWYGAVLLLVFCPDCNKMLWTPYIIQYDLLVHSREISVWHVYNSCWRMIKLYESFTFMIMWSSGWFGFTICKSI